MEGEMLAWYPDGAVQSMQFFKEGKPIGEHRTYYQKSSPSEKDEERLAHLFHYDDEGRLHGEEKTFYQGGKPQAIVSYSHGAMDGTREVFDPQGHLIEEAHYVEGKLEGKFFQTTPEGKEIITYYQRNLKHGPHIIYYPPNQKGEKIKALETTVENDQIHGILSEYSEQGKKVAETPYVHGKKQGTAKIFAPDAKTSIAIEFYADKKNGLATQYFPNGTVFRTTPYVNDLREGEEITYHPNGSVASVFPYRDDKLNGMAKSFNDQGILVFEAEYLDDLRHGKFNKYYEDGKPYLEQNFVADKLEGEKRKYEKDGFPTVSYYEEGRLVKTMR